jgi:hypothetical protein
MILEPYFQQYYLGSCYSIFSFMCEADVCGDLNSVKGRFAACVKAIPLTARDYYRSCVMDMCSYQGEVKLLHKVKCSSLESFVEECADYGIEMKWRTDKFCRMVIFFMFI